MIVHFEQHTSYFSNVISIASRPIAYIILDFLFDSDVYKLAEPLLREDWRDILFVQDHATNVFYGFQTFWWRRKRSRTSFLWKPLYSSKIEQTFMAPVAGM
eukprot:GEMP01093980.1.p1 GENE.GEMP01093980.1~~GEMP01093980.1.p1  ORF type:complete len:101 (-),score=11.01 GEMP01093980.1:271-573(-)